MALGGFWAVLGGGASRRQATCTDPRPETRGPRSDEFFSGKNFNRGGAYSSARFIRICLPRRNAMTHTALDANRARDKTQRENTLLGGWLPTGGAKASRRRRYVAGGHVAQS